MSSVDVGTGKSTDIFWFKSNTANTTTHPWYLVGDGKRFYFMPAYHVTYSSIAMYLFGDMLPFRANDPWCCMLAGCNVNNQYAAAPDQNTGLQSANGTTTGNTIARGFTGVGSSVPFGLYSTMRWTTIGYASNPLTYPFPSPSDNSIHLLPVYIFDYGLSTYVFRGTLPGLMCPLEATNGAFANKDRNVISNGKTFMSFRPASSYNSGNVWFDISGPWV